jgi:hypothetical protein
MKIESGLLDHRFELVGTREAGERIAGAFAKPDVRFTIVGERWQPGHPALLIERQTFMEDLVRAAFNEDSAEWKEWLEALGHEPGLLPTFIAGGVLKELTQVNLDPGAARLVRLSRPQQRSVAGYLRGYLAGVPKTPIIDVTNVSAVQLKSPGIAVAAGKVLGVYLGPVLDALLQQRVQPSLSDSFNLVLRRSGRRDDWLAKGIQTPAAVAGGVDAGEFSAFPRVTVRAEAVPDKPLPFVVGFSESADPQAQEITPIKVNEPDGNLLVIASAEGATIEEPCFVELPLEMAAEHTFVAQVAKNAEKVVLRVKYFHRNNLVGSIAKPVPLAAAPVAAALTPGLAPLRLDEEAAGVDLILLVENSTPGYATWTAFVPSTGKVSEQYPVMLGDATRFAKELAGIRKIYGDSGSAALQELYGTGKQIAALIPAAIRATYLLPALKGPQPPSILLLTDQAFVPWELARFGPKELGRERPAFLGQVARIGRWWTAVSGGAPRSHRKIENLSAVAATKYNGFGGWQDLPHALAERSWLVKEFQADFKARPVEADLPQIQNWLGEQPPLSGHLGHIALHGYADAQENAQGLVLGDGKVLTPNLLAGDFYAGDVPRFEAIFLNACQVGTAGERLGRMAGFPGALLGAGAAALVAPLWEVEDKVAKHMAQEFYTRVLMKGGEVAEVMRQLRSDLEPQSITPAAYIYYGHPCLQLTR